MVGMAFVTAPFAEEAANTDMWGRIGRAADAMTMSEEAAALNGHGEEIDRLAAASAAASEAAAAAACRVAAAAPSDCSAESSEFSRLRAADPQNLCLNQSQSRERGLGFGEEWPMEGIGAANGTGGEEDDATAAREGCQADDASRPMPRSSAVSELCAIDKAAGLMHWPIAFVVACALAAAAPAARRRLDAAAERPNGGAATVNSAPISMGTDAAGDSTGMCAGARPTLIEGAIGGRMGTVEADANEAPESVDRCECKLRRVS